MAETPDQNNDDLGPQQAAPNSVFIEMKSVPQRSYARDLRLRDGDVIVAIDGVACHLDIAEFEDVLLDARDDETSVFVTIARDQMFFEIFMTGPLGVSLDYTRRPACRRYCGAICQSFCWAKGTISNL